MVGGGWLESDYSVCPRPLLQFLQFFQFMSGYAGYIRLCQSTLEGRDVELDNSAMREADLKVFVMLRP